MILILTQCFAPKMGGIEGLMTDLAASLAHAGEQVTVLADGGFSARRHDQRHRIAGQSVRRFGGFKPWRRRAKARAVERLIRRGRVEGIIADSWKSLEHLRPLPKDLRVVCLAHGMELPAAASPAKAERIRAAYAKAALVASNSAYTAAQAERFISRPTASLVVTPPFTPPPFADEAARDALRSRLGLGADAVLLASLCRLEERKGVDYCLDAMKALLPQHPNLYYAIAGGGDDRARLEKRVAALGLQERVTFLGRVSETEKAALLDRCDLFLMPSRRVGNSVEGFGIVYLEAAWFGAPAIAGREGGAADAVIELETGLLVEADKPEAVGWAIETLLRDEALRSRFSKAARAHAQGQTWPRRVMDYCALVKPQAR
ncbi:MAG: glycosyltransferase family 4 protein [Neomegalonema sp.]|nr:glycosyltransferase family 4 protein [Neomegalonema sp.]